MIDKRFAIALIAGLGASCASSAAPPQTASTMTPAAANSPAGEAPPAATGGDSLVKNGDFEEGSSLPWTTSFTAPGDGKADVENGELCIDVTNKGTNAWDAQFRHREMVIQKGHSYTVRFKARASAPIKVRPKIGMSGPPYTEHWASLIDIGPSPKQYVGTFKMAGDDDASAEFAFHLGGKLGAEKAPFRVCVDDVVLLDPEYKAPPKPKTAPLPAIRVNQLGYLPNTAKRATLKTASRTPIDWELVAADGSVALRGKSQVHGEDRDSGEYVHVIDFSSLTKPGTGYVLRAGDAKSDPFDIDGGIFSKLKYDALAYFYRNRSGIPIEQPWAGGEQWTRPAGHLSDKSVPCGKDTGCNYSLDVSGGWYDAGDFGKYVVNGGISVWTLLNQYERAVHLGGAPAEFGDGKLSIPESKNKVPDLLDEARWEIEFLMKMQVPAGKPKAGMAHHKIHDVEWSGIGAAPHEDKLARHLRPPSTAATLNLAAVGAQCARIWKTIDPAFSAKCLAASERAWNAAKANPAIYAPASDKVGGGPYDDQDVSDEFYWAAAELFITTGKPEYRDLVTHSKHFTRLPEGLNGAGGATSSMSWQATGALGTISLAIVPNGLDKGQVGALRTQIVHAADGYLAIADKQGYGVPLSGGAGGKYPWGSNSLVLNNGIILALAYDLTKKPQYLNGVVDAIDYVLGRNPLAKSYVTGYGDNPLENPHHRFWAHQANAKYPKAPPGAVSGGPNSGLEDPYAQAAGLKGCAPMKCFVDHIEAWSVNEITINWNAPLAWVTAYLDEKGRVKK